MLKPPRVPWREFPDVVLHAVEADVRSFRCYVAAKSGDADAAIELVSVFSSDIAAASLMKLAGSETPILASAHAYERQGVNAIPEALARNLGDSLSWRVEDAIVQTNVVGHTGADGIHRLANQAAFDGPVTAGAVYVLVDDFIGQGGTLANLRGFVEASGGRVIAATALTGKPRSAKLALTRASLTALRERHGQGLEDWWEERFGHRFDCLTESEARYLERIEETDSVRDRIVAAEQA